MKSTFIKLSKISLFLVCFGFFMPISCNMNGIDLIRMFNKTKMTENVILLLLVLLGAIISLILSFIYRKHLEDEPLIIDWALLLTSIFCGLYSIGRMSREYFNLQSGAYIIIIGWFLSFIFLLCASFSKRKSIYEKLEYSSKEGVYPLSEENNKSLESTPSSPTTNIWVCTKCGASNPIGTMLCQNCGR